MVGVDRSFSAGWPLFLSLQLAMFISRSYLAEIATRLQADVKLQCLETDEVIVIGELVPRASDGPFGCKLS